MFTHKLKYLILGFILHCNLFSQSTTCVSGSVQNGNNDAWSEECYLNSTCAFQGNPCTANDVSLLGSFIADEFGNSLPSCITGQSRTVYLWGTFNNNTGTSRYAVRIRTEVWINGVFSTEINTCALDQISSGVQDLSLIGSFTYTCGANLQLKNTWISWETSAAQCKQPLDPNYNWRCGQYSASKCFKEIDFISFLTPSFTYSCGTITALNTQVCFTSNTTGGTAPYTYLWNFGDGNTSTSPNPCHTYTSRSGTYNVTLTITDFNGIDAGVVQQLNLANLDCCLLDITCPSSNGGIYTCVSNFPAGVTDTTGFKNLGARINDFCGTITITYTDSYNTGNGCPNDTLILTRTYTISDAGSSIDCIVRYKMADNVKPTITCPINTTVDCSLNVPAVDLNLVTGSDNCSLTPMKAHLRDRIVNQTCANRYELIRTYTIIDACNNIDSCQQIITVADQRGPSIICPSNQIFTCGSSIPLPNPNLVSTADLCGNSGIVSSFVSDVIIAGVCSNNYSVTRTYMATDICSNTHTCIQTLQVKDTVPPTITCPIAITINCGSSTLPANTGIATATDLCHTAVTNISSSDITVPLSCVDNFRIIRTWTATDSCANVASCMQSITIQDTMRPSISCPAGINVSCTGSILPLSTGNPIVNDNCTNVVTDISYSDNVGIRSCNGSYTINRTWTAIDSCSNMNKCIQDIIVNIDAVPVVQCPVNQTIQCNTDTSTTALGRASNINSCSPATIGVRWTDNIISFICSSSYIFERTFTITDSCAATSTCVQRINVVDNTKPGITCPSDIVVLGAADCERIVNFNVSATDNCGFRDLRKLSPLSLSSGSTFPVGTTPFTYVARDCAGNSDTCRFSVTVIESSASLACNDLTNISLDENCTARITADLILEGKHSDYSQFTVTIINPVTHDTLPTNIVSRIHIGTTLKVIITNTCTNIKCHGSILIEDKLKPIIVCRSIRVNCDAAILPTSAGIGFPKPSGAPNPTAVPGQSNTYISSSTAYDNCGPTVFSYIDRTVSVNCPPPASFIDTIFRTWTVKDSYGNTLECVDTILRRTASLNNFICPPNYDGIERAILSCSGSYPRDASGHPSPSFTGIPIGVGCRNINYTYNDIRLNVCSGSYKIVREWFIVDWCTGRDTTCIQLIKILDDRGPIIRCRPLQTINTSANSCSASATITIPEIINECSSILSYDVLVKRGVPNPSIPPSSLDAVRDGIVNNKNSTYTIHDLPVGLSWVLFIVTDACGNSSECATEILVEEKTKPTPVCDAKTVTSLSASGWARVDARSFDDGSYDNCELDSILVRRMIPSICGGAGNLSFSPYIDLCCDDTRNNPIQVIVLVKDKSGNSSECMVELEVQDKIAPVVTCLPNITVSCTYDYSNLEVFGNYKRTESERNNIIINDPGNTIQSQPRNWGKDGLVIEDCRLDISYRPSTPNINSCGTGSISRTFTFSDGQNSQTCVQNISIVNYNPYNGSTIVPVKDTTVIGCLSSTNPDITGRPSWPLTLNCTRLSSSYTDQIFYQVENACFKIIRKWVVIDDCNPNFNWTRVQIIKVANNSSPVFAASSCNNRTFEILNDNCTGFIELIGVAGDDCTDTSDLQWSYQIDVNNNGSIDINGSTNHASGTFTRGTHRIIWTVEDGCGNRNSCSYFFTGTDRKAPTPYCRTGIVTIIMPSSGSIDVWASDLNFNSSDNCSPSNALIYSFSRNSRDVFKRYTCDSIPNGISKTFDIRIYVTDEAGNQDYCDTKVIIQDGLANHCPDNLNSNNLAQLSGEIITINKLKISQVDLSLSSNESLNSSFTSTNINGQYSFYDLPLNKSIQVRADKNDDPLNGISTADIVIIQKHILGKQLLSSPYYYLAADVNNSKSITSADISLLRKLILGIHSNLPENKSWKFVDAKQNFEDPKNPFPFIENVDIISLQKQNTANFIGVKLGDVNSSAQLFSNLQSRTKISQSAFLSTQDILLSPEQKHLIPIYLESEQNVLSLQFTIACSDKVKLIDVMLPEKSQLDASNISKELIQQGLVSFSANNFQLNDLPLIYLIVETIVPIKLSDAISTINKPTPSLVWLENQSDELKIELRINATSNPIISSHSIIPNPWSQNSFLEFNLSEDNNVQLEIYNSLGKNIYTVTYKYGRGVHKIELNRDLLQESGIYFYNLQVKNSKYQGKMFVIN